MKTKKLILSDLELTRIVNTLNTHELSTLLGGAVADSKVDDDEICLTVEVRPTYRRIIVTNSGSSTF